MYQDIKNFKQIKGFRGKSKLYTQCWMITQSTLFRLSPQFMYSWRNFLLRLFGATIGKGVFIRPTVKVFHPWKLKIGNWSWIGDNVSLLNSDNITIGSNTVISQNSYLAAGGHDYTKITFDTILRPIKIEDEVWIQSDVFIAGGVTIGIGTVVGYRSTVNKDLPPKMICYGNPAKPIKPRLVN